MTWSSFSVTRQHKASGRFATVSQLCIRTSHCRWTGVFRPMPITRSYTTCSVMETLNLKRYQASWDVLPLPSKTSNSVLYSHECDWGISFIAILIRRFS